jgi:DNA-binding transcriptional ArsR family regulator
MPPTDNGSDKLNRFQAAFERGQKGDVGSFDIWLEEHGFIPERVERDTLTQYFQEHPDATSDHQDALETIGEYTGFAINQSGVYHLPLIGPSGVGKTQLLHTVLHLLPGIDANIESRLFDATAFGERTDGRFELDNRVEELSSVENPVVCIDDFDRDKRVGASLSAFDDASDDALYITTWSPEGYAFNREEIEEALPASKEVYIEPLSEADTVATVQAIYDYLADEVPEADKDAEQRIWELSHGIPGIIVLLTLHALREAFMKELEPGSCESVEAAGERLHLPNVLDQIYDLSDSKMEILRWILLSLDERGRSPGDLVDKLDRDKSTISYHLSTLSDEGLVESQREGRHAYYQVTEAVKPFVQLRLNKEAEFNA